MAEYMNKELFLACMGLTGDETKYGNRDAEHQHRSYSTYMSYEIMDCVDDSLVDEELVRVPCKIGDVVYGIRNYQGTKHVQKGFVGEMFFTKDMKLMIVVKYVCRGYWNEKVFPTYEAAEAAMRKDGDGNG